jgi:hypothetical protein
MQNQHRIPVRWIFCKNIPFSHMQHVALRPSTKEAEEQRRLHGGLQPMKLTDGTRALSIYARYPTATSVLMDFKHYDEAEARGVVAESGDASVRAAQKFQQKMVYQQQHSGGSGRGGGFQHHQNRHHQNSFQQQNQQQHNQMFPTPSQAASGANTQSNNAGQGSSNKPTGGYAKSEYRGQRNQNRSQSHQGEPPRRLVTADEERVTLPTRYVYEPVVKEKQKQRKQRTRVAQETGEGGEYTADEQAQYEQQQQEAGDAEQQQQETGEALEENEAAS